MTLPIHVIDPDVSENEVWEGQLDGRAIHAHLLWAEPATFRDAEPLLRRHARVVDPVASLERVALSVGLAQLAEAFPNFEVEALSLCGTPETAVLVANSGGPTAADEPTRKKVVEARCVLDEVGLAYVADLAIGVVVVGTGSRPGALAEASAVVWLDARDDIGGRAESLLRQAAAAWVTQWHRAELLAGLRAVPADPAGLAAVTATFADSYVFHLDDRMRRRRGDSGRRPAWDDLVARRDDLARQLHDVLGLSVLAELVAYMYPGWFRRQFATKSAFDYMRTLRPVTEQECAEHFARWASPNAVR